MLNRSGNLLILILCFCWWGFLGVLRKKIGDLGWGNATLLFGY